MIILGKNWKYTEQESLERSYCQLFRWKWRDSKEQKDPRVGVLVTAFDCLLVARVSRKINSPRAMWSSPALVSAIHYLHRCTPTILYSSSFFQTRRHMQLIVDIKANAAYFSLLRSGNATIPWRVCPVKKDATKCNELARETWAQIFIKCFINFF